SSRGCTLKCAFCTESSFWRKFRYREPAAVVDEMVAQRNCYGTDIVYFCDSLLNSTEDWLNELCDRILHTKIPFLIDFAYMQARFLSPETIQKMARAGFRR